ncbi:MAG: NAD(P)/FAD-dependent oxidoreductase [Desulfosalsimonas sp.]
MEEFDVIIVGGGPAGLFAAWHLAEHSGLSVLLLEKGKRPDKRRCRIDESTECPGCNPCDVLCGIGGAGLFSDGKLNFIPRLGKTDLTQFMPPAEAQALIDETECVFDAFGMTGPVFPTDIQHARDLRKHARKHGIDLLIIRQKHLGSDRLPEYIGRMQSRLEKTTTIRTMEPVTDVVPEAPGRIRVISEKNQYLAESVILAPGRAGADWVSQLARRYGISMHHRGIEVGVRVEVHREIMDDLCNVIYDPTFFIQTAKYDDETRTFCTNNGGFVTQENYRGFVCVNGHAYMNRKSGNTNFAFLSKVILTDPVTDNQAYGESIGRLASLIGGGRPLLQRMGDLKRGRRSTWARIEKSTISPTLKNVVCGDIAMALPERILTNIMEGMDKLNQVLPGVSNDETLLYAPEIKFFATQVETTDTLETPVPGLFVAGDGPGVAGNIVSAAATGLIPAKEIIRRKKAKTLS